jgi:dolichyl-phosphate-mannose--protein O-mannosyl transferase
MNENNATRSWLGVCLLIYALLTIGLIARVPLNAAPDEFPHMSYVEYIATHNALPVFQAISQQDNQGGYEFHQPPLYYAVSALGWKVLGAGVQNYFCRVVSLLCGIATLVFLWRAMRELFPERVEMANYATGLAALWPLHQAVGASAGNDAMAGLVCAAMFWKIAQMSRCDVTARDAIIVGVLFGLGLLTKNTCLVVGVVMVAALGYFAWRRSQTTPQSTLEPRMAVMLALVVTIVVGGWWLVRNRFLYGDPLGQAAFNQAFAYDPNTQKGSPGLKEFMAAGAVGLYFQGLLLSVFWTCWGFFGGPESARKVVNIFNGRVEMMQLAPVLPLIVWCATASAVTAIGLVMRRREEESDESRKAALNWWTIGLALVVLAWMVFAFRYMAAGQARYFHPALLPIACFATLGWRQFWSWLGEPWPLRIASGVTAAAFLWLSLWNILVWRTLV